MFLFLFRKLDADRRTGLMRTADLCNIVFEQMTAGDDDDDEIDGDDDDDDFVAMRLARAARAGNGELWE